MKSFNVCLSVTEAIEVMIETEYSIESFTTTGGTAKSKEVA